MKQTQTEQGDSLSLRPLTPFEIAEAAIDSFIEYRDEHGYPEERAKWAAINEVMDAQPEGTRS